MVTLNIIFHLSYQKNIFLYIQCHIIFGFSTLIVTIKNCKIVLLGVLWNEWLITITHSYVIVPILACLMCCFTHMLVILHLIKNSTHVMALISIGKNDLLLHKMVNKKNKIPFKKKWMRMHSIKITIIVKLMPSTA